jgi:hypothetical protein
MRAVNSEVRPAKSAIDMSLTICSCKGKYHFTAIPLDNFDVTLEVDFLLTAKISIIPHFGVIMICDETSPSFVSGREKGFYRSCSSKMV